MPPFAIEAEDFGRIYNIRGTKKKAIRKELVAPEDVKTKIEQDGPFGFPVGKGRGKEA